MLKTRFFACWYPCWKQISKELSNLSIYSSRKGSPDTSIADRSIVPSNDSPLYPDQEHSNDLVVPCGGIIQNLFRENFRDEQQYLVNEFVLAVFESGENVAISYIQIATIISFYLSLICSQSASKQNIRNRYIFNRLRVSFESDFWGRYKNGELFFKHSRSIRSPIIKMANFFQVIKMANNFLWKWRTF